MKRLGLAMCSMLVVFCTAVFFGACGETPPDEKVITSVTVNNLKEFYHVSDTINFNGITLKVTYNDNSTATLTKGEFDITAENAKADTQFIINTNGLYAQTAGELETGEYQFTGIVIGNETTYQLGTVNVSDNMNLIYNLTSFNEPAFVSQYKENIITSSTDESSFYKADSYYVGDDNEFRFKPILTLQSKTSNAITEISDYNVTVRVERKDGDAFVGISENDTTYFTYQNFAFDFTQDAINQTFRITMKPTDFLTDFAGNNVAPVVFTVTVADGWNAYEAIDLGRISLVSENFDSVASSYIRPESAAIFYNEETGAMKQHEKYYEIWSEYLTRQGETNLTNINGLFLHENISVTPSDLPEKFFISETEANAKGQHLLGSLRDFTLIYTHYMENDFTFNGNFFKLDFSEIPWGLSNTATNGYYYPSESPTYQAGHSTVFNFLNKKTDAEITTQAKFINVDAFGNTKNIISNDTTSEKDPMAASGGLIYMKSYCGTTIVENCIAKAFLIAWYAETSTETEAFNMSYIKTYDCFNSGMFSWGGAKNTLSNSEFKRFGGPVMLLTCNTNNGVKETSAGWTVDKETTTLESFVSGGEVWFKLMGADSIFAQLMALDRLLNYYGNTFTTTATPESTTPAINMIQLSMEADYLGSSEKVLNIDFDFGGIPLTVNGNSDNIFQQLLTSTNYKSPIFMSNGGTVAYMDSETSIKFVDASSTTFVGDKLYIAYPLGNTVAYVALDLYPYQAQA